MSESLLLAVTDNMGTRLGICAVACVVGAGLIFVGIDNIKKESAEESGKARLVNEALGRSNEYERSTAVLVGWVRIGSGIAAIIFGITYIFVGPFLAR